LGIDFKQIDREDSWDDYIILQAIVMTLVHKCPGLGYGGFPMWNGMGMWQLLLLHAGPTEFVYYWQGWHLALMCSQMHQLMTACIVPM
jgi:hypothetical protein